MKMLTGWMDGWIGQVFLCPLLFPAVIYPSYAQLKSLAMLGIIYNNSDDNDMVGTHS